MVRGTEAAGPRRDFVGYGRRPPAVHWPGGASVVVNVVVNYESGAEYSLGDGDGRNDTWGEYSYQIGPEVRDLGTEAHFEFGSRAGIWRLVRLFDRLGVPVTLGACALALQRNPELADWLVESGNDVIAHGWRWTEMSGVERDQERDEIRRAVQVIGELTGTRPRGWYLRSFPSVNTRELLVEEGGFVYDSDSCNDELPWFADVGGRPFLVVPYSKLYNDVRYLLAPTYATPRHFYETLRSGLDYLCGEAGRGEGRRMMTIGVHERWSGQAARTSALADFLEYARDRPDVVLMRRGDIADWWIDNHHDWDPPAARRGRS